MANDKETEGRSLTANQKRTGVEREDSPNDTKRTGRSDGFDEPDLRTIGPRFGESTPEGGKAGRDSGLGQTQGRSAREDDDGEVTTLAIGAQPLGDVEE